MGKFSLFEKERNTYVGNITLDGSQLGELSDLKGFFKRILHKRIDRFYPDKRRVITRFHNINNKTHLESIIIRALKLGSSQISSALKQVMAEFSMRHKSIEGIFISNYAKVSDTAGRLSPSLSKEQKLFIGSLFTMEYSYESTSLFNPSVVLYPKQNDLKKGEIRVVFCFRATGEGHISSIIFRSAVIDNNNDIYLEPISRFAQTPEITIGANGLGSNYEASFPANALISERVIFPVSRSESNGMEDARFVRFQNDDGSHLYYATYTAYNGFTIFPHLIETKDFHLFKMSKLHGAFAKDKGMALFPRKINGKYAMISRGDGENLFLIYSDNLNFWNEGILMQEPSRTWELVKIGNCGSPIETKEGWLFLTHGIGPMRKYCIGIELLDLHDPSKIIAKMEEPLLSPTEEERDGYVPNVVYSCGSMLVRDKLIIPYAASDSVSSIAVIGLNELLNKLLDRR